MLGGTFGEAERADGGVELDVPGFTNLPQPIEGLA
jgi:hypothetical protein